MISVICGFISSLLCGILVGIGFIAFLALYTEQFLLACFVIGGVLLAIEVADLRYYVTLTGEMIIGKGKPWKKVARSLVGLAGNIVGVLIVVLLLNAHLSEEADAFYILKCKHFADAYFNSLISGLLGGFTLYAMHRAYRRTEGSAVGGLLTMLLTPILFVKGVDCGLFDLFLVFAAQRMQQGSLRNLLFVFLGNLAGISLLAAAYYLLKTLEKLNSEKRTDGSHRHHHHRRSKSDSNENA